MRLDLFGKATFLFCWFSVTSSTSAADRFWIDTAGGPFADPNNWSATSGGTSGASVPNVGDNAIFDQAGSYAVLFSTSGPAESDDLRITTGDVTFQRTTGVGSGTYNVGVDAEITGGNLTLGIPGNLTTLNVADDLIVRHSASASNSLLSILFGSDVTVADDVGIGASSAATGDGTVIISDIGSSLTAPTGLVNIGGFGNTGVLNVQAGASAHLATSSDMVGIGNSGFDTTAGTLLVDGGSVVNTGNIEIASLTSLATGSITVDGTSSVLEQTLPGATLTVGSSSGGAGVIDVINGGTFTTGTGATVINATGTLNIDGGNLNARGGLDNSTGGTLNHHDGTLTITGGAFQPNAGGPTDNYNIRGSVDGQVPHLVIGAGGTTNIGGDLTVGYKLSLDTEDGELTIRDGGQFTNDRSRVGVFFNPLGTTDLVTSHGSVTVSGTGSSWTSSDFLSLQQGDLTIADGATVSNASAFVGTAAGVAPFQVLSSSGSVLVTGTDNLGNPSTWNLGSLILGNGGFGALTIEQGANVVSSGARVGFTMSTSGGPGFGTGVVSVDGAGSLWTISGNLDVAFSPSLGKIDLTSGGVITNAGSTVLSGGSVTVDGLNGASAWHSSSTLTVAGGTVLIRDGGLATTFDANTGSGGEITVTGTNGSDTASTWNNTAGVQLNDATLTIEAGGVVTTGDARVATFATAIATISVTGANSRWTNSDSLSLGGDSTQAGGIATLTIADHARVTVGGPLKVWQPATLNLNGGTLQLDSTVADVDGQINFFAGTLHLTDAGGYSIGANAGPIEQVLGGESAVLGTGRGLVATNGLTVPADVSLYAVDGIVIASGAAIVNGGLFIADNTPIESQTGLTNNADLVLINSTVDGAVSNSAGSSTTVLGTVDFNDAVSGPGDFFGPGTINFNGGLSIGASPAEVSVEGDVRLAASNDLVIELGGLLSGSEFDHLLIGGTADLGGTLDIDLINGFLPSAGDTFEIITAASVFNTFAVEDLPDIGGLLWDVSYNPTSVVLSLFTPFTADFDLDGDVDGVDLNDPVDGWQARYGTDLDGGNFLDWQRQHGSGVMVVGAKPQAVPEPAALLLLISGTALISRLRQIALAQ